MPRLKVLVGALMHEIYDLNALTILKTAKNLAGEFVLIDVDNQIQMVIRAMRKSPGKGGSLNININMVPASKSSADMIAFIVEVKNIKAPSVAPSPIMAFTSKDGKTSINNPTQVEMFGDAKAVDMETGEITEIDSDNDNKITPIGSKK